MNDKKIVPLFFPNLSGNKSARTKLLPQVNKIYKSIVGTELTQDDLKGKKSFIGFMNRKHNFIVTHIKPNENIDFSKADYKLLQKSIADTLERTANNKGSLLYKQGGKSYNLDWTFSQPSTTRVVDLANEKITTMLHELGHQVHFWATTDNGAYSTRAFPEFPKTGMTMLTKYGQTNDKEFHAELFNAYALNKNALQKFNPALVTYMEGLLDKAIKSTKKYQ